MARARKVKIPGIRKGKARGMSHPRVRGLGGELRMPGVRRGRKSFATEMNK
jgi:hypothetical protein